jgi:hypothetical protein
MSVAEPSEPSGPPEQLLKPFRALHRVGKDPHNRRPGLNDVLIEPSYLGPFFDLLRNDLLARIPETFHTAVVELVDAWTAGIDGSRRSKERQHLRQRAQLALDIDGQRQMTWVALALGGGFQAAASLQELGVPPQRIFAVQLRALFPNLETGFADRYAAAAAADPAFSLGEDEQRRLVQAAEVILGNARYDGRFLHDVVACAARMPASRLSGVLEVLVRADFTSAQAEVYCRLAADGLGACEAAVAAVQLA